jgi:transcriptional regulator with XRE-family HTH domain
MKNKNETFGAVLRRLREARGLSRNRLGLLAGLTGQAIGALEDGRNRPMYATAARLADALGVGLDDLPAGEPAEKIPGKIRNYR